jgi:hypothetical protein
MKWLIYRAKATYWINKWTYMSILQAWSYAGEFKEFFLDDSYISAKDCVIEDLSYWDQ